MRSFGLAKKPIWSASRPSDSAFASEPISDVAVTKSTECPASTTARPSPIARCVLPTPGGPNSSTFSAPAMKWPVASSRTSR